MAEKEAAMAWVKGIARQAFRHCPEWVREGVRAVIQRRKRKQIKAFLDRVSRYCGGFAGRRVLEVGSDGGGYLIRQIKELYGAEEVVGINPALTSRTVVPGCRLEAVDVRSMPFSDASFDVIVSSSAFEHIHDLDQGLREMYRILRPEGSLYSHFGPIWSTTYGHHLWFEHNGRVYTYWNTVLPPFCHLLMTERELAEHCRERFGDEVAPQIAEYVFRSPDQNQLMFEDYERIFREGPFEVLLFKGYDDPELADRYQTDDLLDRLKELRNRHPNRFGRVHDGITVLLTKPS